jgi:Raf kinase inhibitor-like YbhB/YbcL family protein
MKSKDFGISINISGLGYGFLLLVLLLGCKKLEPGLAPEGAPEMSIQITSSAFKEGDKIPRQYTCDDKNISPPLDWTGVPVNSTSLTIIMDDPDAPAGTWVHWVLFDLKPDINGLGEGKSENGIQGKNDFGQTGYGGPCPPRGSNHRYFIKIYALDIQLGIKTGASKAQVENLMKGHILAQGQLMGKYAR